MHVIGRGKRGRETYPLGGATSALAALTNRYLVSATPDSPDPFTATSPNAIIVAAVNVTRRGSGFFVLATQMLDTLAAADTQEWAAVLLEGATVSGGTVDGQWLIAKGSAIVPTTTPTGAVAFSQWGEQADATTLTTTVTLVGINPTAAPPGDSTIIIAAETLAGTLITPGPFFGSVFELP